jgi:hypothetical protein
MAIRWNAVWSKKGMTIVRSAVFAATDLTIRVAGLQVARFVRRFDAKIERSSGRDQPHENQQDLHRLAAFAPA